MVLERFELVGQPQPVGLELGADAGVEDVHGARENRSAEARESEGEAKGKRLRTLD
jgi:hypothetical protein